MSVRYLRVRNARPASGMDGLESSTTEVNAAISGKCNAFLNRPIRPLGDGSCWRIQTTLD